MKKLILKLLIFAISFMIATPSALVKASGGNTENYLQFISTKGYLEQIEDCYKVTFKILERSNGENSLLIRNESKIGAVDVYAYLLMGDHVYYQGRVASSGGLHDVYYSSKYDCLVSVSRTSGTLDYGYHPLVSDSMYTSFWVNKDRDRSYRSGVRYIYSVSGNIDQTIGTYENDPPEYLAYINELKIIDFTSDIGTNTGDMTTLKVVNCNEWISLRTQPDTSASRITTIPLGAYVTYISKAANGFYKICYNGMTGYALSSYLGDISYSDTSGSNTSLKVVNCNEWISLRTQPDTSASRITTIPLGAYVTYISKAANGFYKVEYRGYVGYALGSYLN